MAYSLCLCMCSLFTDLGIEDASNSLIFALFLFIHIRYCYVSEKVNYLSSIHT